MDLIWFLIGGAGLAALFAMRSVLAAGRQRREDWQRQAKEIVEPGSQPSAEAVEQAERAERHADRSELVARRIYYAIAVLASVALTLQPVIPLPGTTGLYLRMVLAVTLGGATLLLLRHWQGSDDDRERVLQKHVRRAGERLMERQGVAVRDPLTGLYTREMLLRHLEKALGETSPRATPITCLMIEIVGLDDFRRTHGDRAADRTLQRAGESLADALRAEDIVCRYHDQRFAAALLRCEAGAAASVRHRVASTVIRSALDEPNRRPDSHLEIATGAATLPGDADTPVALLRAAEARLEGRIMSLAEPDHEEAAPVTANKTSR